MRVEPEELLRQALRSKADEARIDLSPTDIAHRAARSRRVARRRALVALAAAAVVAIVVPTAVLLRPTGDEPSPAPAPSPSVGPSSTGPAITKAPAGGAALRQIPLGRAPGIAYLHAGTVHLAGGGTTRLPDPAAPVSDFTSYHGGWLVGTGEGRVRWYDNTGARQSDAPGVGFFAVSEDGTRTAYAQAGAIHIGSTSGMGQGEQTVRGDAQELRPIGFLRNGDLVYQATETTVAVTDGSTIPDMTRAHAVSAAADLIAGEDANGNTIVVSASGRVAWTSATWAVSEFSADGRYAAATHTGNAAGSNAFAVLDAGTGKVVAEHDDLPAQDSIGGGPVMDTDGSLLVAATSGNLQQTVLRLDRDGTLTRATPLFRLASSSDMEYIAFATRP